jgi:site-specific DNA recombinase
MSQHIKVACYLRVSTDDQCERRTVELQREYAVKYCDLHGYRRVTYYVDDGITGTLPMGERPEGARLLADAKAGKFTTLLVYRLDRLARNPRIVLNTLHELEQCGVQTCSMSENIDTSSPAGRMFITMLAGFAGYERETILERMWHGANRAASSGKWLGGIVPYGYRVDDDGYLTICTDPLPGFDLSEADVIRMIYHLIAEEHYSTIAVADYLNGLHIPTSYAVNGRQITRGKRKVNTQAVWSPGRIRNMIVSPTYRGEHLYGKRTTKEREVISRPVPAIVTPEIWYRTQEVLRENLIEATRNSVRPYLLRGLIKCGSCGHTYCGVCMKKKGRLNKGEPYPFYICVGKSTKAFGHAMERCKAKNVPAEWIEDLVWRECVHWIENPGDVLQALATQREEVDDHRQSLTIERIAVEKALAGLSGESQKVMNMYRKGLLSEKDTEEQLQQVASERDALEARIATLSQAIARESVKSTQYNTIAELLDRMKAKLAGELSFEDRRAIIKALVKEIIVETIGEGNGRWEVTANVHITYTFTPDSSTHGHSCDEYLELAISHALNSE